MLLFCTLCTSLIFTKLYEFETLLFVGWYPGLEEHRVCSVLSVEERHVSVDPGEQVHALVSLLEVGIILGQSAGTPGTSEGPARGHFDWRLPGDVADEEVHGEVLAVHEGVHGVSDGGGHDVSVDITVVLMVEGSSGQHHAEIVDS